MRVSRAQLVAGAGIGAATVALTAIVCLPPAPGPVRADTPQFADRFIPLAMARHDEAFPAVPTAPSATATRPPPTRPPTATRTPTLTPTPGPSPTPTVPGGPVDHPTDPETIVLQVGWSDNDQKGAAWEEMNGTPLLTVYGDGRAIGGPALFDWRQALNEGTVTEDELQAWLRPLVHRIDFLNLNERYTHPELSKYAVHAYLRFGAGDDDYMRVTMAGYPRWLTSSAAPGTEEARVQELARLVNDMVAFSRARFTTPYVAQAFTVLSHEINPILTTVPTWTHALDIAAISDRAPADPEGGNKHGPPGHAFVDGAAGKPLWDLVTVDARRDSAGYNQAAEYSYQRRRFAVGVRQEVPGGSPFLPDRLRGQWYRRDQ